MIKLEMPFTTNQFDSSITTNQLIRGVNKGGARGELSNAKFGMGRNKWFFMTEACDVKTKVSNGWLVKLGFFT